MRRRKDQSRNILTFLTINNICGMFAANHTNRRLQFDHVMSEFDFTLLGEGRNRRTYLSSDKEYVIKLPISEEGLESNIAEHETYRNGCDMFKPFDKRLSPCRIVNGCFLLMKAVKEDFGFQSYGAMEVILDHRTDIDSQGSNWIRKIDCCQVGVLSDGRLVAYDYE